MTTLTCCVARRELSYPIEIGRGILASQASYLSSLAARFALIADERVASLYGETLCQMWSASGLELSLHSFPAGEPYKTRATKERIEDQLFERGLGRDSGILALGGGIATDLAGYIAATYCRGLPLVMIPTSLLAMADASIGGKVGVNVPRGKNLLGSIYPPKKVLIDPTLLETLPLQELSNGLVEIAKHALIGSAPLFAYLEEHAELLLAGQADAVETALIESCRIKIATVEEDEMERGKRRLLNFGHTIGHALETASPPASLSHGEAVAIGLLVESYLSVRLGRLDCQALDRIERLLRRLALPLRLPCRVSPQQLLKTMELDKKSVRGTPRVVLLNGIGSPSSDDPSHCTPIEERLLHEAIAWMNDDLCRH